MPDSEPPRKRSRWDSGGDEQAVSANGRASTATAAAAALLGGAAQTSLSSDLQSVKLAAQEALTKRAAQLQQSMQQGLAGLAGASFQPAAKAPSVVTLDASGRLLDERGKEIRAGGSHATIKMNQMARNNPLLAAAAVDAPDITANKYYDPRMSMPGALRDGRKKRAFSFVSEGHFTKRADELRAKAAVEQMLRENRSKQPAKRAPATLISQVAEKEKGPPPAMSEATVAAELAKVPKVEWWDAALIRGGAATGYSEDAIAVEHITHYVEHPVPIEPPAEPAPPPPQPLPLTKKERKKLRTQRRLAAEKEKQDQIRCGLMAAPPPKVKISNLMQAMKDEAVADPSALEAKVRSEVAQRLRNHEERNLARKLTPQQRREKKRRKMLNDPTGGGAPVTLYRIHQMPNKQKLYKIDINAQQNHLTGVMLLSDECNLVVVEGGPKAQRRYRKLLLHRIDWTDNGGGDDEDEEEEEEDEEDEETKRRTQSEACKVVWEGFVVKPHFKAFRVEAARSSEAARKLLKERNCEHYWDMAVSDGVVGGPVEEEDDEDDDDSESGGEEGGGGVGGALDEGGGGASALDMDTEE